MTVFKIIDVIFFLLYFIRFFSSGIGSCCVNAEILNGVVKIV